MKSKEFNFSPAILTIVLMVLTKIALDKGWVSIQLVAGVFGVAVVAGILYEIKSWKERREEKKTEFHRTNVFDHPLYTFYYGTPLGFSKFFENRGTDEYRSKDGVEIIIGSSIQLHDGTIFAAMGPGRHHHVIAMLHQLGVPKVVWKDFNRLEGFVTNKGRHVDRHAGFYIAKAAGQIIRKTGNDDDTLWSEDIWETPLFYRETTTFHGRTDVPKGQ